MNVKAGDYICYTNKNELGKVKRTAHEKSVFAWFHMGDTASCIPGCLFTVVLSNETANELSDEEIVEILKQHNFSNDYAIEAIVKKRSC